MESSSGQYATVGGGIPIPPAFLTRMMKISNPSNNTDMWMINQSYYGLAGDIMTSETSAEAEDLKWARESATPSIDGVTAKQNINRARVLGGARSRMPASIEISKKLVVCLSIIFYLLRQHKYNTIHTRNTKNFI